EVADQRESAREQERCPDQGKRARPTAVEPEQQSAGDGEVQGQVGESERADQSRDRPCAVLHATLDEEMERLLERDDLARVSDRNAGVAGDEPAARLVEGVEHEYGSGFGG